MTSHARIPLSLFSLSIPLLPSSPPPTLPPHPLARDKRIRSQLHAPAQRRAKASSLGQVSNNGGEERAETRLDIIPRVCAGLVIHVPVFRSPGLCLLRLHLTIFTARTGPPSTPSQHLGRAPVCFNGRGHRKKTLGCPSPFIPFALVAADDHLHVPSPVLVRLLHPRIQGLEGRSVANVKH